MDRMRWEDCYVEVLHNLELLNVQDPYWTPDTALVLAEALRGAARQLEEFTNVYQQENRIQ